MDGRILSAGYVPEMTRGDAL